MAYEYRYTQDFTYGTLSTAAAVSDTSLSSVDFASLASGFSVGNYLPMVLLNPATKTHEKVWLTGHAAGAETATVVRGRESTGAQAWPAGTQWIVSPTVRDVLAPGGVSALPTDPHTGMRTVLLDKGEVWEKTYLQGWLGSVRAVGADMGRAWDGATVHANGRVPQLKAWTANGTTNSGGLLSTPIPNGGFLSRMITAVLTRASVSEWFMPTINATSTKTTLVILASTPGGGPVANSAIDVSCLAVGY